MTPADAARPVREHGEGVPLRSVLGDEGALSPQASLLVLRELLVALVAAHARGVVHGALRPESVVVSPDGAASVVDFGTATRARRESLAGRLPYYLAPEVGEPSPAADLYAATAIAIECLSGAPPFYAEDLATLRRLHRYAPRPTGLVPAPAGALLARGLAAEPGGRPAGAAAQLAELDAFAARACGPAWAADGRAELAALAAGPRPPLQLDPATFAPAPGRAARRSTIAPGARVAVAVAAAASFGLALAAFLPVEPPTRDPVASAVAAPDGSGVEEGWGAEPAAGGRDTGTAPLPLGDPTLAGGAAAAPGAPAIPAELPATTGETPADPSAPAPTPGTKTGVTGLTISSFAVDGDATRLVVDVVTSGTGPVELVFKYATAGRSEPGAVELGTVTNTLVGDTSYSVTDVLTIPASCPDTRIVTVLTAPVARPGTRVDQVSLPACEEGVPVEPRSDLPGAPPAPAGPSAFAPAAG